MRHSELCEIVFAFIHQSPKKYFRCIYVWSIKINLDTRIYLTTVKHAIEYGFSSFCTLVIIDILRLLRWILHQFFFVYHCLSLFVSFSFCVCLCACVSMIWYKFSTYWYVIAFGAFSILFLCHSLRINKRTYFNV